MSDDAQPPDDGGWVVQPAGVEIQIAVGHEAELTPAIREAIDDLVRALEADQDVEVEAFSRACPSKCASPGYGTCNPRGVCAPKVWFPCASKEVCSIIVKAV
ncbi:MAG: hypothetical protein QOE35_2290 [Actinomycetota bacterium]|jgi:hypothetical protein